MGCDSISDGFWLWGLPMFASFFFFLVVVGLMIVGVVGFVTNVVVVVGVAVVRARSVVAWVDSVGQGGSSVRGLKVERES